MGTISEDDISSIIGGGDTSSTPTDTSAPSTIPNKVGTIRVIGSGDEAPDTGSGKTISEDEIHNIINAGGGQPVAKGALTSSGPSESWLQGALKGASTATYKGLANIAAGPQAGAQQLAGAILERGQSFLTGRPLADVQREHQQFAEKVAREDPRLASSMADKTTGEDIYRKWIVPHTGEYVPSTEYGRLGMAGMEAGVSALGPGIGGGVLKPAPGVGNAAFSTLARLAPQNIGAAVAGQGVSDITGSPVAGFAASLLAPYATSKVAQTVRPLAAPILPGAREPVAAEKFQGIATDPRKAAETINNASPEDKAALTTGQLTGDSGIIAYEKKLRDANDPALADKEAGQQTRLREQLEGQAPANANSLDPVNFFKTRRADIENHADTARSALEKTAQSETDKLGDIVPPEVLGANARNSIENVRKQEEQLHQNLYNAVGNPNVVASGVRENIAKIAADVPKNTEISADVQDAFKRGANLNDIEPFRELRALSTTLGQKITNEALSNSPDRNNIRLLTQAKKAVQDGIDNSFQNQQDWHSKSLASGATPTDPVPNMATNEVAKLKLANEQFAKYSQRFEPTTDVLAGRPNRYQMSNSDVLKDMVKPGAAGYEPANSFLKAANTGEVQTAMQEHMLNDLRSKLPNNGLLTPKIVDAWKTKWSGALRAVDEVSPGFSTSFDGAGNATQKLQDVSAKIADFKDSIDKSAASALMKINDPQEVSKTIGSMIESRDGPTKIQKLLDQTGGDKSAIDGMQKAAIEYMSNKLQTTKEIGTTGEGQLSAAQFQKFVRNNDASLRTLFADKPGSVDAMNKIADHMMMIQRPVRAAAAEMMSGQRRIINTDSMMKTLEHHGANSVMGFGLMDALMHGEPLTAAGIFGAGAAAKLIQKGQSGVNGLVKDATLNPDRALKYLEKVPADRLNAKGQELSKAILRGSISSQSQQTRPSPIPNPLFGRARGGRIEANRLGREADRANKSLGGALKPLMGMRDEDIAQALRLAR